jgi:hypothetical protein
MLGHCPGSVRVARLLQRKEALEEMRRAGFGEALDALEAGRAPSDGLGDLYHLPIPLRGAAELHDLFPEALEVETAYQSLLAGKRAWLPQAVEDFFANGGERLWLVRIPEGEGQPGFLPAPGTRLSDARTLRGIAVVLVLTEVGVMALPDLERLRIPARLSDVPPLELTPPAPRFELCSRLPRGAAGTDEGETTAAGPAPIGFGELLERLQEELRRHRPDLQCLFSLPLSWSGEIGGPQIDPRALQTIETMKGTPAGPGLRHIQFLFPYLRGPNHPLASCAGLVAGAQAGMARRAGTWRSAAGRQLLTLHKPYPRLTVQEMVRLRESPGIGVIHHRGGGVMLDDERLAVPALHRDDWADALDRSRFDGYRSGEVQRFLGHLTRRLQALGDALVFDTDHRDSRPRLLLEQLFRSLHRDGALRGRRPEEAYDIRQTRAEKNALVFEIEIAPAFPIDRVQLTFTNRSGDWRVESSHV